MGENAPHGTTYRYQGRPRCRCVDCCAAWRRAHPGPPQDPTPAEEHAHAYTHGIPEVEVGGSLGRMLRDSTRVTLR